MAGVKRGSQVGSTQRICGAALGGAQKDKQTPNKQGDRRGRAISHEGFFLFFSFLFDVCTRSGFSVGEVQRVRGGSASDGIRLSALLITNLSCLLLSRIVDVDLGPTLVNPTGAFSLLFDRPPGGSPI